MHSAPGPAAWKTPHQGEGGAGFVKRSEPTGGAGVGDGDSAIDAIIPRILASHLAACAPAVVPMVQPMRECDARGAREQRQSEDAKELHHAGG